MIEFLILVLLGMIGLFIISPIIIGALFSIEIIANLFRPKK